MDLIRLCRLSAALLVSACCFAGTAHAEAGLAGAEGTSRAAARLDLFVRIPEVLRLRLLEPATTVRVTEADIQRGWLETSFTVEITSNSRVGFSLHLQAASALSNDAVVEGFGSPIKLSGGAGQIRLSHHGQTDKTRQYPVRVRLALGPDARPGLYARPLGVLLTS